MRTFMLSLSASLLLLTGATHAAEFKCSGERIERNGSSWGAAKSSGGNYLIEKGGSTVGYAKKSGSKWSIENSSSSTLGYLNGSKIDNANNSSWGDLSKAKSMSDCPDPVAAALWVLKQSGKL